ncbi:MAG: DMT family transporter [Caldisericia bacterium]|nr:DMT family transporter [Caldisericia bacterium]
MNKKYIPSLIFLAALWGSDFMFIKIGVSSISPPLFTSLRFLIATITLFIFLKIKKISFKIELNTLLFIFIIALVDVYIPQIFISTGEKYIASGLTSLILSSSPIFTFIFAHIFLKDEKLTLNKILFVILGFLGVFIIFYKEVINSDRLILTGLIFIILASLFYGLGVILLKKISLKYETSLSCFYLVLFGFLISIPYVLTSRDFNINEIKISSVLSLFYVGIVLQSFAYTFFLNSIRRFGASKTSFVGYIVPIFGVIYGVIFLKESININTLIGGSLIILSIYLIEKIK